MAAQLRRQPLGPQVDQLGELAGLGEADGAQTLADGLGEDAGRGGRGPRRRVEKEKMPAGPGGAAFGDDFDVQPR